MKTLLFVLGLFTILGLGAWFYQERVGTERSSEMQIEKKTETKSADEEFTAPSLEETEVKLFWRGTEKENYSTFIDQDYIKSIPDPVKAAVGYVATFIGSDCWWDGEANPEGSNLDCKLNTALGLGYQCSNKHLEFLRKWFAPDEKRLSELDKSKCPLTPYTSTFQQILNELSVKTKDDSIIVDYKALSVTRGQTDKWRERLSFVVGKSGIKLIKKEQLKPDA